MSKFVVGNINNPIGQHGFLCGSFLSPDHPLYTKKFEVAVMKLGPDSVDKKHYHKEIDEFCILLAGEIEQEVDGELIKLKKDGFIYQPAGCITELKKASEGTLWLVVKAPSLPTDKFNVE